MTQINDKPEIAKKVILLGDVGVGKTSFVTRVVHNTFQVRYKATIGLDFTLKQVEFKGTLMSLQLWDSAGRERFGYTTRVYMKETAAAFLLFDLHNRRSLEQIKSYRDALLESNRKSGDIIMILIGTKSDLPDRQVTFKEATELAEHLQIPYFEVSAKTGNNMEEVIIYLSSMLTSQPYEPAKEIPQKEEKYSTGIITASVAVGLFASAILAIQSWVK